MFQKPDSMETDNTVLSQIPFNSRWPMRSWKYKKKRKRNVAMSEANWRRARGEPRLIDPWRGGLVNVTQSNGSASLKCQLYPDKPSRFILIIIDKSNIKQCWRDSLAVLFIDRWWLISKWPGRDLESWPLARYLCPHLLGSKASVWQPEYANW